MASIKSGVTSDLMTVDPISKAARVSLYNLDGSYNGQKATYRASTIIPLVVAVTANRTIFNIIGSASKTIVVKRICISGGTLTAVGYFTVNVVRYSTATTGGTSTVLVAVPLDTSDSAATAVVRAYTAVPTDGALVGTLATNRWLWQATVAAAAGLTRDFVFDFGDMPQTGGITLRGVTQELALVFPVVLASAGTLSIDIEWTEE